MCVDYIHRHMCSVHNVVDHVQLYHTVCRVVVVVCVHACICLCVHAWICLYVRTWMPSVSMCVHVCGCAFSKEFMCACVYVCAHVYRYCTVCT